jgi:hypothetical protein
VAGKGDLAARIPDPNPFETCLDFLNIKVFFVLPSKTLPSRMPHLDRQKQRGTDKLCLVFLAGPESQSHHIPTSNSVVSHRMPRLKCNRQVPCTTCAKNGIGSSCNYAALATNGHERRDEGLRSSEAHLRLRKLEEMVTSLMQQTVDGTENPSFDSSHSNSSFEQSIGTLSVNSMPHSIKAYSRSPSGYQGGTHWSAILENVCCSPPKKFMVVLLSRSRFEIFKGSLSLTQTSLRSQFLWTLQAAQIS